MQNSESMKLEVNEKQLITYIKCFFWIYWIPKLGKWWFDKYMDRLHYSFEEDYFQIESGVFFYSKKQVPYSGLREATLYRGPLCQLLNLSIVMAQTAGQNVGGPEVMILCPEDPESVITELIRRKNQNLQNKT